MSQTTTDYELALKSLDELEKSTNWTSDEDIDKDLYNRWGNVACRNIKSALTQAEKEHKALEIFGRQYVSVFNILCCENVEEYNILRTDESSKLIKDDFDLLKEVFGKWKD